MFLISDASDFFVPPPQERAFYIVCQGCSLLCLSTNRTGTPDTNMVGRPQVMAWHGGFFTEKEKSMIGDVEWSLGMTFKVKGKSFERKLFIFPQINGGARTSNGCASLLRRLHRGIPRLCQYPKHVHRSSTIQCQVTERPGSIDRKESSQTPKHSHQHSRTPVNS